jgi:hypothetical protein
MIQKQLPDWLVEDERRVARLGGPILITWDGPTFSTQAGRVSNFSALGCCVEASRVVPVGSYVKLSIGESQLEGWIVWRTSQTHGIDFNEPIPVPLLDRLLNP